MKRLWKIAVITTTIAATLLFATACDKGVEATDPNPGGGDEPAELVPVTINFALPASKSTVPTPEENQINRVTIITFKVPTSVADRSNPAKYTIGSFMDINQTNPSSITIPIAPEVCDIYLFINLPHNNLFGGDSWQYPPRFRLTQADMALQTNLAELFEKRIHVRSQYTSNIDYNGLTMSGQLYSINPVGSPALTLYAHRLAAKVNFTTVDNSSPLHYINAQSFLNIAAESPLLPPLPGDRSAGALASYKTAGYCPDLTQTDFYALSSLDTYNLQYAAASPKYKNPDANNLIPVKDPSVTVDTYYVDELRYSSEAALNRQTCTRTYYLLQNRTPQYATRALVRIHYTDGVEDIMKFLPLKINDGTHGGSGDLIGRNRIYNVKMTFNGPVTNYVTNPWDYTYRTKVVSVYMSVEQSSEPW